MVQLYARGAVVLTLMLALVPCGPAFAAQRTFVSTSGVNNPACSLIAPCRDFASAIAATSPGGEVIVLDSGGYGKVTITQPVSIIAAPGVYAGISAFAGDTGVTISAGVTDKVTLSGLTINGVGGGIGPGVQISSGGQVDIERCTITNMATGILASSDGHVYISHSSIRNSAGAGLQVTSAAGSTIVQIDDSRVVRNSSAGILVQQGTLNTNRTVVEDNAGGIVAFPGANGAFVTITDSVLSGSKPGTGAGLVENPGVDTGPGEMKIIRTTIANNAFGGFESSGSVGPRKFVLSDSTIVANGGVHGGVIVAGPSMTGTITGSTISRNATGGVAVLNGAFVTVSGSTISDNNGYGVSAANGTTNVSGSTIAGNVGADLQQAVAGILRSSGNNALTGRGAADISGTITANPLK